MLNKGDLKKWLHRPMLGRDEKLLIILATFDGAAEISDVIERAREAGLKITPAWNASAILRRTEGKAIRTPDGWELTDDGLKCLHDLGIETGNPVGVQIAAALRSSLAKVKNDDTRSFMEEAIRGHEHGLYRSAIVMSWLAAVHVLQQSVVSLHLKKFNAEAKRIDSKWRDAVTTDDLGRMKEGDFLDRLVAISMIGKNVKTELKQCLDRRNAVGHPTSMKVGPNVVAHHLEVLLLNVFNVFN